ncbi:MAG: AAA family ATPase [Rhodopila sp.]
MSKLQTKDAAERMYARVSWGIGVAIAIFVTLLLHITASADQQRTIYAWLAKWPGWMSDGAKKWAEAQAPGSLSFDACLILIATLLVRAGIGKVPRVNKALRRWSEPLAQSELDVLSQQAGDRRFLSPTADDTYFEERAAHLQALLDLARDDRPYRVVTVHGPSGIGKTRLALAWLAALRGERRVCLPAARATRLQRLHPLAWQPREWEVGFLRQDRIKPLRDKRLGDWRPLRPTAIVLDATEMSDAAWRDAETDLVAGAQDYLFPVRVLVLSYEPQRFTKELNERTAADETQIALPALSGEAVRLVLAQTEAARHLASKTRTRCWR